MREYLDDERTTPAMRAGIGAIEALARTRGQARP